MPDFEIIKMSAPYWADLPNRHCFRTRTWIVDDFEVVVARASRTSAVKGTEAVRHSRKEPWTFEFLHMDGRLFRPHFGYHEAVEHFFEKDIPDLPPGVGLAPERALEE